MIRTSVRMLVSIRCDRISGHIAEISRTKLPLECYKVTASVRNFDPGEDTTAHARVWGGDSPTSNTSVYIDPISNFFAAYSRGQ